MQKKNILLRYQQAVFLNRSRSNNMRRISPVPAPISYSYASRSSHPIEIDSVDLRSPHPDSTRIYGAIRSSLHDKAATRGNLYIIVMGLNSWEPVTIGYLVFCPILVIPKIYCHAGKCCTDAHFVHRRLANYPGHRQRPSCQARGTKFDPIKVFSRDSDSSHVVPVKRSPRSMC